MGLPVYLLTLESFVALETLLMEVARTTVCVMDSLPTALHLPPLLMEQAAMTDRMSVKMVHVLVSQLAIICI